MSTPKRPMLAVFTNPSARRKSETLKPKSSLSTNTKKGRRISCGVSAVVSSSSKESAVINQADNGSSVLRMGTRISLSALHRERLRLTSEVMHNGTTKTYKKHGGGGSLDLDYDTMEFKSILPAAYTASVVEVATLE